MESNVLDKSTNMSVAFKIFVRTPSENVILCVNINIAKS